MIVSISSIGGLPRATKAHAAPWDLTGGGQMDVLANCTPPQSPASSPFATAYCCLPGIRPCRPADVDYSRGSIDSLALRPAPLAGAGISPSSLLTVSSSKESASFARFIRFLLRLVRDDRAIAALKELIRETLARLRELDQLGDASASTVEPTAAPRGRLNS